MTLTVPITVAPHARDLGLPAYATAQAAGLDLRAAVAEPVTLAPGAIALIPTGLSIALPPGFEAQIRPRSGLALHHGLTLVNSPGTIDADYRGEIGLIVINHGPVPFTVTRGLRLAQMVVARFTQVAWRPTDALPATPRGDGGFGSTGTGTGTGALAAPDAGDGAGEAPC